MIHNEAAKITKEEDIIRINNLKLKELNKINQKRSFF